MLFSGNPVKTENTDYLHSRQFQIKRISYQPYFCYFLCAKPITSILNSYPSCHFFEYYLILTLDSLQFPSPSVFEGEKRLLPALSSSWHTEQKLLERSAQSSASAGSRTEPSVRSNWGELWGEGKWCWLPAASDVQQGQGLKTSLCWHLSSVSGGEHIRHFSSIFSFFKRKK